MNQQYEAKAMPHPRVNQILNSLNREVLNQLDLAASIDHPGESGRAREQILANYLRRLVPKEFGIDTGFVFDALGNMSRQIDLVIHRAGYYPVFEIGGVKHYMVESVVAVIENKAAIASQDTLASALDNIKSVKALDRTNSGRNRVADGRQLGAQINPQSFYYQVFGAIVTEKSLTADSLKDGLLKFMHENDRRLWPNSYADVRGPAAVYFKRDPNTISKLADTADAEFLGLTNSAGKDERPALLELTERLLDFLRVAPLVDYSPSEYFGAGYIYTGYNTWRI
jgi:hypothetical protein